MTLARLSNNFNPSFPFIMDKFLDGNFMGTNFNNFNPESNLPAINIKESENEFQIEVAAPGLKKENFKISYENGRLSISSEKTDKQEEASESENYTHRQFNYQSFVRSFRVSEKLVESNNIEAKYTDGILYVTLPKREEVKPKPAKEIAIA